tara:strand:- start:4465 stop:4704 length:240 start_codon:yes stop_codon:yes gene_type:complete
MSRVTIQSDDDEVFMIPISEDEVPIALEIYQQCLESIQTYFLYEDEDKDMKSAAVFIHNTLSDAQDKLCLLASPNDLEH